MRLPGSVVGGGVGVRVGIGGVDVGAAGADECVMVGIVQLCPSRFGSLYRAGSVAVGLGACGLAVGAHRPWRGRVLGAGLLDPGMVAAAIVEVTANNTSPNLVCGRSAHHCLPEKYF